MATTTNDRDSASVMSSSGFFKRISRKRSIGPSSPTSPSIPDSAPWLPPLEGIDSEQHALPPVPSSPRVQPASVSTATKSPRSASTAVPFLNLPSDIAAPVAPPKNSYLPIIKGGPQLPPPSSIDTSLHLEFAPTGPVLLPSVQNTPTVEKTEPVLAASAPKPKPVAPAPAPVTKSPRKEPSSPRKEATSPRKEATSPRKEASSTSEKSTGPKEGSSLTKTLGALFRRGKKDGADASAAPAPSMLATPDEFGTRSKRMSIPSSLNPLRRNSFTPSRDALVASAAAVAATTNGASKSNGHVDPPAQPATEVKSAPAVEPAPLLAPVELVHPAPVPVLVEHEEDDFIPVTMEDATPPADEEVPKPANGNGHAVAEETAAKEEAKPIVEETPAPQGEKVESTPEPLEETPAPVEPVPQSAEITTSTEEVAVEQAKATPVVAEAAAPAPADDALAPAAAAVEPSAVPEPVKDESVPATD